MGVCQISISIIIIIFSISVRGVLQVYHLDKPFYSSKFPFHHLLIPLNTEPDLLFTNPPFESESDLLRRRKENILRKTPPIPPPPPLFLPDRHTILLREPKPLPDTPSISVYTIGISLRPANLPTANPPSGLTEFKELFGSFTGHRDALRTTGTRNGLTGTKIHGKRRSGIRDTVTDAVEGRRRRPVGKPSTRNTVNNGIGRRVASEDPGTVGVGLMSRRRRLLVFQSRIFLFCWLVHELKTS
ncbi:putative DNA methylase, N-6 adenine-specific [Helianthus annuus]|nr:putative DNA methylase, N-6 adenine-specific [Helianthus annuus]